MNKIKSTIISAYACDPYKGSEPGIAWNWIVELARLDYDVFVITRGINQEEKIKKGLKDLEPLPNLSFYYYDLPKWLQFIEKTPFGVYSYYFFWQIGILTLAKRIVKKYNVDIIHHLTWGVFRQPSFLHIIEKPFVFGPVGGGEMTPNRLLRSLPFKNYIKEQLRVLANYVLRESLLLKIMYKKTIIIFSRTEETAKFLPSKFNHKIRVQVDIGIRKVNYSEPAPNNKIRALYVGRLMGWKGVHLSIDAVNKINQEKEMVEFTIVGSGPFEKELKRRAKSKLINFIDWVPQKELYKYYETHDCFLFPSFHDSGGMVVLEAFSNGLPVICLDIGGPNKLVDNSCGFKVKVQNKNSSQIVNEISEILKNLHGNRNRLDELRKNAFKKAEFYNWCNIVQSSYNYIDQKLNNN